MGALIKALFGNKPTDGIFHDDVQDGSKPPIDPPSPPKGSIDLNTPQDAPAVLTDPSWIVIAKKYLGEREIVGPHHNPLILRWWADLGMGFKDDETPWCGGYVGGTLVEDGRRPANVKNPASARSYLDMDVELDAPAMGCVVVFWRGTRDGWQGHVGFVVGVDQYGNLMVLGGNQGNMVSIKPYKPKGVSGHRVLGYFWPGIWPYPERFNLPVINSNGKLLSNEA